MGVTNLGGESRLISTGDADPSQNPMTNAQRYPIKPQGRPAHAELSVPIPGSDPTKSRKTWDEHQASNRTIEVFVVSTPLEGFENYWSAKRCWPKGQTRTFVSPDELAELELEAGRIQVYKADQLGHVFQQPAAPPAAAAALTPEVASMPEVAAPAAPVQNFKKK